MISVTITPQSINLLLDGRMRTISKTHINYAAVATTIKLLNDAPGHAKAALLEHLRELVDIPTFIAKVTEGRVKIGDNGVLFDNAPVVGVIADRLLTMLKDGFNPRPLARFLQRLKTNPSTTAIDEMYLWLESGNLPITEDGCFLAFKLVEEDFASGHRNPDGSKLYNHVGSIVQMDRTLVDTDRNNTCSVGLHFCSWQYLPSFGINRDSTRVVVLKIAPEDVVSIPYDYNNSKGRAWRYLVLQEVPKDECEHLFNGRAVVDSFGVYDGSDEDEDESYDDEDEYHYDTTDDNEGYESPHTDCANAACAGGFQVCDCEHGDDPCGDGIDGTEEAETFSYVPVGKVRQKTLTAAEVRQMVEDYGQRGMSRMTGIPRTTIQEWLKRC